MSEGEGGGEGKLPSVDHGRRTDEGRDKNHHHAVEGSAYTCTATWRQPGLRGGCVEFCLIRTDPDCGI